MAKTATIVERLNELFNADPRNDSAIAASLGVSKQTVSACKNPPVSGWACLCQYLYPPSS